MTWWLLWRLVKWLGLAVLGGGLGLALGATDPDDRRRGVQVGVTLGLMTVWTSGYALAQLTAVSLRSTWVGGSLLISLGALQALVWATERPDRPRRWAAWLGAALLVAATALMVWRPGTVVDPDATPVEEAP